MNIDDYRLALHTLPDKDETTNRFTENVFPVQVFVVRRLARLLLPEHLYSQFCSWQNQRFTAHIRQLLSSMFGKTVIVLNRSVANYGPKFDEFKLFFSGDAENDMHVRHVSGFGNSFFSHQEALSRAIGEFLERHLLSNDLQNGMFIATSRALGRRAARFDDAPLYLPWQRKKVKSSFVTRESFSSASISWVRAHSLLNFLHAYVPAQRVFWMIKRAEGEGAVNQPTSNGNGGGFSVAEATLSGLYELIERDSFMCHWLLKLTPRRIAFDTVMTPGVTKLRSSIRRYKLEVMFLDMTSSFGVPVVACLLVDRAHPTDPKITVGAACGHDAERLFDKSLMETLSVKRIHWYTDDSVKKRQYDKKDGYFDDIDFDKLDMEMRSRIWRGKYMTERMDFLRQGKEVSFQQFEKERGLTRFRSAKEELRYLKKVFSGIVKAYGAGYHPYVYRIRHPVLSRLKYAVVSTIVPNLFPLYLTEHMATLDVSRLTHWYETARQYGMDWDGTVKNYYPHPFP